MLEGDATLTGEPGAPSGTYHVKITKFASPSQMAGLPPLDMTAAGQLEGLRTTVDASITAGQNSALRIKGSAPLSTDGALDLAIKGKLDLALANQAISAAGRRVKGTLSLDGRAGGSISAPQGFGSATLTGGSFEDVLFGVRLNNISGRCVANGDRITLENISAATPKGGKLTADGAIRLDVAGGFPGTIRIRAQNAQLVQSSLATAVTNLDLNITGPLARRPNIGGEVNITQLDVPVPERLPGNLQPLAGTRHVQPTPTAAARLAIDAKARRDNAGSAFDAVFDLMILAPGKIWVHGRGLDAHLGGHLKITGTLTKPQPVGAFNLVRGQFQLLNTQLDLTRANLTFSGDLSPELDFVAMTQAGGASINIAISGAASDPQFSFTSSPDLPQDEILARLLFGESAGELTPTQGLALVQAMAIYSGGNSALEGVRRSLGLGDSTGSDNPLTKAFGNRVSFGVRTGATPAQTGVGMDVTIYKQLKAKAAVDATGAALAGVGTEFEW
jgi:translocation and assembly module TamB